MLDQAWTLSPSVALRPEPFGALAYHFGNRKLTFLKRPELVAVVRALGTQPDVRSALVAALMTAPASTALSTTKAKSRFTTWKGDSSSGGLVRVAFFFGSGMASR